MEDPIIYGDTGLNIKGYTGRWAPLGSIDVAYYFLNGSTRSRQGLPITKDEYYEHLKVQEILNSQLIPLNF